MSLPRDLYDLSMVKEMLKQRGKIICQRLDFVAHYEIFRQADARRKAGIAREARSEKTKENRVGQDPLDEANEQANLATSSSKQASEEPSKQIPKADRLDPALFAQTFSKKATLFPWNERNKQTSEPLSSGKKRKTKSKAGFVRGRDGQPMRRVADQNGIPTTVRVLDDQSVSKSLDNINSEEFLMPSPAIEPALALPNAKARAFKKRRIDFKGVRKNQDHGKTQDNHGKKRRSDNDPLGLEDPAFMDGGEFAHILNGSKKDRRHGTSAAGKAQLSRRGGDAGRQYCKLSNRLRNID